MTTGEDIQYEDPNPLWVVSLWDKIKCAVMVPLIPLTLASVVLRRMAKTGRSVKSFRADFFISLFRKSVSYQSC
jgi:hypothetical protein